MSRGDNFFIDLQLLRNTEEHMKEIRSQRQKAEITDKSTMTAVRIFNLYSTTRNLKTC
jgi:hypothetical protein